jgi:hypothetical protein
MRKRAGMVPLRGELEGGVGAEDVEGGGPAVGEHGGGLEDAHGGEAVGDRAAGARVDRVRAADAVDLVVVAVVAGGGEGLVGADGDDGEHALDDAAAGVGALDAEAPGAAVGREAAGEDLAADVDEGAGEAEVLEAGGDAVGGVAGGDGGELEAQGRRVLLQGAGGEVEGEVLPADEGVRASSSAWVGSGALASRPLGPKPQAAMRGVTVMSKAPSLAALISLAAFTTARKAGEAGKGVVSGWALKRDISESGRQVDIWRSTSASSSAMTASMLRCSASLSGATTVTL